MPPRMSRHDGYDWARCQLCGHLRYADQNPGDACKFCPCDEQSHWPADGDAK